MRNYLLIFLKSIKREILKFAKDNNTDKITMNDLHSTDTYKGGLEEAKNTIDEIIYIKEEIDSSSIVRIIEEDSSVGMSGPSKRLASSAYRVNNQLDQVA